MCHRCENKCKPKCPCDSPKKHCKHANICQDFCPVPPTDEIYNQYQLVSGDDSVNRDFIMEVVEDESYPLSERKSGIYGYDPVTPTVPIIDGGELYSDSLSSVDIRIHEPNQNDVIAVTVDDIKNTFVEIAEFFTSRGLQIPGPDTFPINENSYNFRDWSGTFKMINIKFHYENEKPIPSGLDLVAFNTNIRQDGYIYVGPTGYEEDLINNRDVRFAYPLRVPLTQDKKLYCRRKKCGKPIAFYDKITQQISIKVKCIDFLTFSNPELIVSSDPIVKSLVEFRMKGFEGKFQLTKRSSRNNDLISSNFEDAEILVQVSDKVNVKCSGFIQTKGPVEDLSYDIEYRNENGNYSGCILALMNGGSSDLDIFSYSIGGPGAFATTIDSFLTQGENIGDNTNTLLTEVSGSPSSNTIFDTGLWILAQKRPGNLAVSVDFINNPPVPENITSYPIVETPSVTDAIRGVLGHEYVHNVQQGMGIVSYMTEGEALGIELDTDINFGIIGSNRPNDYVQYITNVVRGKLPLLSPENVVDDLGIRGTYGEGIWWNWFMKNYDPYHQVMRRTNDIIATNSDLQSLKLTDTNLDTYSYGAISRLAFKQALNELNSLDVSDVYRDWVISLSLLRNNTSISDSNPLYASTFPYWVYQDGYPLSPSGVPFLPPLLPGNVLLAFASTAIFGNPGSSTWWAQLDQNANPNTSTGTSGFDTAFPQLGTNFNELLELEDLSSVVYVVDKANSEVSVKNTQGKIVVTMHQFTSDGTPNTPGVFNIQGPFELALNATKTFDLTDFSDGGLIRLVVSNVAVTDFVGINNILKTGVNRITGQAEVTSV